MNIQTLLPCGEKLKPLLKQSIINSTDLKEILQKRGVFFGDNDRKNYISFLTMSPLSPSEFEELQELQKKKEDSIKQRNYQISSISNSKLNTIIPLDLLKPDELRTDLDNFDFNTDLNFSIQNQNSLTLEYEIKRENLTKDWANTQSSHIGRIHITKNDVSNIIKLTNEFTSSETFDTNETIIKILKNHMIAHNVVDSKSTLECVTSEKFNNKNRFQFMLSFANDSPNNYLMFNGIYNLEIGPHEKAILPDNAQWMSKNVRNMIISGKSLEEIEFFEPTYHDSLIIRELQAKYKFKIGLVEGTCVISFGFPHYFRANYKSHAFEASVPKIYFSNKSNSSNSTNASRLILAEFEEMKSLYFEKFKSSLC